MNVDRQKTIEFLEGLSSHSVYDPTYIVRELQKCGFTAEVMIKKKGTILEEIPIESMTPYWGKPGISSLPLLDTIYQFLLNKPS